MLEVLDRECAESLTDSWEPRMQAQHGGAGTQVLAECLMAALDEVDYGIVLIADNGRTVHANHAASAELDEQHPLQLVGRELRTRRPEDMPMLSQALENAARRGLRRLLTLGDPERRVGVAVVPIGGAAANGARVTLLMLSKPRICEPLSIEAYARAHELTPAETRVLQALSSGLSPEEAAQQLGVALCTVRTQTGMIRMKTGMPTLGAVLRQVAVLPPLMSVLRNQPREHTRSAPAGAWCASP